MFLTVVAWAEVSVQFSPHTRGCSGAGGGVAIVPHVFPAYAGMFRGLFELLKLHDGFPRIRGDVPVQVVRRHAERLFSPHTRGCSGLKRKLPYFDAVFPAYAGMFRKEKSGTPPLTRFPRIRGDVPN